MLRGILAPISGALQLIGSTHLHPRSVASGITYAELLNALRKDAIEDVENVTCGGTVSGRPLGISSSLSVIDI